MNQDLEQLHLLSIFHYVVGGMAGLFALIPVIHIVIGLGLASGAMGEADPTARLIGGLFAAAGGMAVLLGLTFAVCMVIAGRKLARRESYTFCLVMAAVACMFMPFGTVLGVFTIIVLTRDSVKALFGAAEQARPPQSQA